MMKIVCLLMKLSVVSRICALASKMLRHNVEQASDDNKDVPFTIPKPIVVDCAPMPSILKKHNEFKFVASNNGLMYRVKSENSSEVLRMHCAEHCYEMSTLSNMRHLQYVKKESLFHFICRLFVTHNGNYFYQFISSSGVSWYEFATREDAQKTIQACESDDKFKMINQSRCRWAVYSPEPGTYTAKTVTSEVVGYDNMKTINSWEIIDQSLYDKIIEEL